MPFGYAHKCKPGFQPIINRYGSIFILMDFPEDVKRNEQILLQKVDFQTGIGGLFKVMQAGVWEFMEGRRAVFE